MRITIENLPPIATGSFEVRPLTIFIGPNNTGKSRAGQLAWALARAMDRRIASPFSQPQTTRIGEPTAPADDTGGRVEERLRSAVVDHAAAIDTAFGETLDLLFGPPYEWPIGSAVFQGAHGARVTYAFGSRDSVIDSNLSDAFANLAEWRSFMASAAQADGSTRAFGGELDERLWRSLRRELNYPSGSAFYLPAGRGAFASTWDFYAKLSLRGSGLGSSARLPFLAADFLENLGEAASRTAAGWVGNNRVMMAVDLLDEELIQGRVSVGGTPSLPYPLLYSNVYAGDDPKFTIELSKASSSVNDLGPVSMILRQLVRPGDLVVIDEPEAHLHPENHRLIAHALVRLANAGVTVIAPTHSSTIIHQISNLVRASNLDEDRRERLGLEVVDVIQSKDVGIYDFRMRTSTAEIEEIAFDPEYGYAESEFFDVAMNLNNETANIDLALPVAS